jgi:glycosyltransferase involved in cell wall biosynthesis
VVKRILSNYRSQKKYISRIYQETDKLIFLSQALAKDLEKSGFSDLKYHIVPLAIDTDIFSPGLEISKLRKELELVGQKTIVFIGRIVFEEKGIEYLLEAIRILKNQGFGNLKLLIIGKGEKNQTDKLRQKIKDLGISSQVLYLGPIANKDLPYFFNLSDISVFPSIWFEVFGRVAIESLSCGTPVICTDGDGLSEVNIHNQTGLVVPKKDAQALAQAIKELLSDENSLKKFGEAGRRRALENYTYEKVGQQLISIFKQIVLSKKI